MAFDLITRKRSPRNWALGASFTTSTDDVDQRLKDLTIDVNNLNNDITKSWFPKHKNEDASQRFVAAWIAWRDGTYQFVKGTPGRQPGARFDPGRSGPCGTR